MQRQVRIAVLFVLVAAGPGPAGSPAAEQAVARVLDDWHAAASAADEARYFGHFTPDGIFLGTDAGERWTVEEFRAYARPHFSQGRGWTYVPHDRHVMLSNDGTLAWFDEKLKSEKYGALRGTGVLRNVGGAWKLAHYSMTFTIPNDSTSAVLKAIQAE